VIDRNLSPLASAVHRDRPRPPGERYGVEPEYC